MSRTCAPRAVVPMGVAALALAMLLGLQPLTTDLYLPTLPALATHFAAPMTALQMTMAATVLCFGIGQLFWGPVADRFGRRPVLLTGVSLYLAASIGATFASTIDWLILMRAVQGATMAAAVVCGRAMVRDLYEPQQGAQVMARGLTGLGIVALTGPLLGGALTAMFGWRAAFAAISLLSGATLLFIARRLPETQPNLNLQALHGGPLLRTWARMPRNRTFAGYAGLSACSYAALVLYLAGSSFVMMRLLGLSPVQYGLTLLGTSVAYITGTVLCRRLVPRWGLAGTARHGMLLCLTGALTLAALALAEVPGVWAVLLPQMLYTLGHGLNQPCCQTGAVAAFPREAGTAAALAGSMLAVLSFFATWWLGHVLDTSVLPIALGEAALTAVGTVIAFTVLPMDRLALASAPART